MIPQTQRPSFLAEIHHSPTIRPAFSAPKKSSKSSNPGILPNDYVIKYFNDL
jgi:hypothetical protein